MLFSRRPALAFYEGDELNQDPTHWFGPNSAALIAMLRAVGFQHVEIVWQRSWPLRLAGSLRQWICTKAPISASL